MDQNDVISDVFSTLRLSSSIYFRAALGGDCAVRVPAAGRQIRFHLVLQGACSVEVAGVPAVPIREGDIAFVPRGAAQVLSHGLPAAPPSPLEGLIEDGALAGGLLTVGEGAGRALLLCGFLSFDEGLAHPALDALPPLVTIRPSALDEKPASAAALRLLDLEARLDAPGVRAVLPRLVEIVVIQATRDLVATTAGEAGFLAALGDRQLSRALAALHRAPAEDWTVGRLAAEAGMSRSRFADRFLETIGTTPIAYLTGWRLMRARALLSTTWLSIEDVALACGYASLPSFNRRFKAEFGIGPGAWRRRGAG